MEQENKEMQQTIIYLENLCQTLTAQTASARQDAEIQTRAREVMFRELKDELKDFHDENKKLNARLNWCVRELKDKIEENLELQREIELEKKVVANRLNYYMEELKDKIEENKKLKDKIEELRSTHEIPEMEIDISMGR